MTIKQVVRWGFACLILVLTALAFPSVKGTEQVFQSAQGFPLYMVPTEPPSPECDPGPCFVMTSSEEEVAVYLIMSFDWPLPGGPTPWTLPPTTRQLLFPWHPNGRPIIAIKMRVPGRGNWITVPDILVDTGADITLLRRSYADALGINLGAGRPVNLGGVGGAVTRAWVHEIEIALYCPLLRPGTPEDKACSPQDAMLQPFTIQAAFPESDERLAGYPLLGRQGVINNVEMIFSPLGIRVAR